MMAFLFYLSAAIALVSTVLALTRSNAAHALIYLIISHHIQVECHKQIQNRWFVKF